MSNVRQIMAKGETSVLLRNELDYLDSAERELLLKQAGIISHIGATQALALKAGIGMPWTALAEQEIAPSHTHTPVPLPFLLHNLGCYTL